MQANPKPDAARGQLDALRRNLRTRAESLVATIERLDGVAAIDDPITGRERLAQAGLRLATGQRFRVRSGRALVRFDDGSDVWLSAGAELDLSRWAGTVRTLRLVAGRMLALVAQDVARPFRTLIGDAEVLVTGTAFEATAQRDRSVAVAVLHGSVKLSSGGSVSTLRKGRLGSADHGTAPRVERLRQPAERIAWVGDIGASRSNPRIEPASRATTRAARGGTLDHLTTELSAMPIRKIIAGAIVLAAIGAVAFVIATKEEEKPVVAAPAPEVAPTHAKTLKLRGPDGKDIVLDASKPGELDKALESFPPELREKIKAAVLSADHQMQMNSTTGGAKFSFTAKGDGEGPGLAAGEQEALQNQAIASVDAMKQLIDAGMDPAEAQRVVSQGLSDSLSKQLGKDTNVQVMTMEAGADGKARAGVFIMSPESSNSGTGTTTGEE